MNRFVLLCIAASTFCFSQANADWKCVGQNQAAFQDNVNFVQGYGPTKKIASQKAIALCRATNGSDKCWFDPVPWEQMYGFKLGSSKLQSFVV